MFNLSNLMAQKNIEAQRLQRLTEKLKDLQEAFNQQGGEVRLDFCDCALDDLSFKTVAQACLDLFQKNKSIVISIFDFSGKNTLTDNCKEDLINLIHNLPIGNFISGSIEVSMNKENLEEVRSAIQKKQSQHTTADLFLIDLKNSSSSLKPQ